MLVSGREACRILSEAGITLRSARRVLACGLADEPLRLRGTLLYQEERVQALARRPVLPWIEVENVCTAGFFIARRDVRVKAHSAEQIDAVATGWGAISPWRWLALGMQIERHGSVPLLATVGGFVALGADIVGLEHGSRLVLESPAQWFKRVEACRVPTGPGRPWVLQLPPATPEKMPG